MSDILLESETVALCPSMLNQTWGSGSPRREPSLDVLNLSGLEFETFHNLLPLRPRVYISSANLSAYNRRIIPMLDCIVMKSIRPINVKSPENIIGDGGPIKPFSKSLAWRIFLKN